MDRHPTHTYLLTAAAWLLLSGTCLSAQSPAPDKLVRTYEETARPAEQIDRTYPYDITLADADGHVFSSSSVFPMNGRPTVLMFWLTTCGPCRMELTAIATKYRQWQEAEQFNLMAVSIDFPRNREAFVQRVRDSDWPFPAYLDVNREFGEIMPGKLNGLPQVFLLDQEGNIVHHKRKYMPGDEDLLFEQVRMLAAAR
ncbi:MAG: hypothetical protein RLY31_1851 [Bacteroidota bacterium]